VWCFRFAHYLGLHTPKKIKTFLDADHTYIEPIRARFSTMLDTSNNYNENIDTIFYNKKEYNSYMQEQNTDLEKIWRTRMLLENTPRGNVLFFYDAFKMGFSFYSDEKTISYEVLNAIAMKYVLLYRCRDFFIDESVVPKDKCSPFIKLYFRDEPKKVLDNKPTITNPFARLRKENPNTKTHPEQKKEPEKMKNKFLYLGKMNNALLLQPAPKTRKVLAKFTSPLLETIKMESGVQRETMSYKDFKKSLVNTTHIPTTIGPLPIKTPIVTIEGSIV
jgi:hypothetical protein